MEHRFKCKILNFETFVKKVWENLWILGFGKEVLHMRAETLLIKEKIGFFQNSVFSYQKDSVKDEKKLWVWRNYLQVTHLTKVLYLECIKNYQNSIKIGTIQLENGGKIWRDISPKEDICLTIIHEKTFKTPGL